MLAERLNEMFAAIAPDAPPFTEPDVDRLHRLFPAVNLEVEVESIAAWLPTNEQSQPLPRPLRTLGRSWLRFSGCLLDLPTQVLESGHEGDTQGHEHRRLAQGKSEGDQRPEPQHRSAHEK